MASRLKTIYKFKKLFFSSVFPKCSYGKLIVQDSECRLETDGIIKAIYINNSSKIVIDNNLPDGYGINFLNNTIFIKNLLGKKIKNNNILFRFSGALNPKLVRIVSWDASSIIAEIDNKNNLLSIGVDETKFEDSTLIIGQKYAKGTVDISAKRNFINNNVIKGLYSNKALPNGHQGYYHYYPNEDAYMTGKRPDNLSTPIFNNKLSKSKNAQKLKKVGLKISTNLISQGLNKVSHDTSEKIRKKSMKETIKAQETSASLVSKKIGKPRAGVKKIKKAGKY